jgi:GNAT superfamily N-acetyltransferase
MATILEYDSIDPAGVLSLNLTSLDYALTPERAALIRRLDPRPFPFFGLNSVEDGIVAGQVLVYRLSVMTGEGPEDAGGICAVCTHPAFSGRGIASRLMDAPHERMRLAGMRYSTRGTARHRSAYSLYLRLGYEDVFTPTFTFARRDDILRPNQLRVESAGAERLHLTDDIFQRAATGHLGFSRRHEGFIPMLAATGDLSASEVWLLWDGGTLVGYALACLAETTLVIKNLLLAEGVDAADATSALAEGASVEYLRVRMDQPLVAASLRHAGYPPELADWSTFMVKSLVSDVTVNDACRLLGIRTERFLISAVDIT